MKWIVGTAIAVMMIASWGCGTPEPPAEPTPDVEAQMKTPLELSAWFTDLRFTFFNCIQTLNLLDNRLGDTAEETNQDDIKALNEYLNKPGNIADRLKSQLALLQTKKKTMAGKPGLNPTHYKNLSDLNGILGKLIALATEIPAEPPAFRESVDRLKADFTSLEKLLIPDFEDSTTNLASRKSPENPEFRRYKQLLENVPELLVVDTPVPEEEEDISEPEEQQASPKIWRDKAGNIHMGQTPPEGVTIIEVSSPVSENVPAETEEVVSDDQETDPGSTEEMNGETTETEKSTSLIWTDQNGKIHMGSEAPENVNSRQASDIPLITIQQNETPESDAYPEVDTNPEADE
jgi:hypothetical protein